MPRSLFIAFTIPGILFVSLLADAAGAGLRLGQPAPQIPASSLRPASGGRVALVLLPPLSSESECRSQVKELVRAEAELRNRGVSLHAATAQTESAFRSSCGIAPPGFVSFVETKELAGAYGSPEGLLGVLIDEHGTIRRIVREQNRFPERLTRDVQSWLDGKVVYEAQCARCHGDDGNDASYPMIKPLSGIGNRLSEAQILERTSLTGAVDLTALSAAQRRALSVYVAGL